MVNSKLYHLLDKALQTAYDYEQYKVIIAQQAANGKTSGYNQTQALIQYTKLNYQRMQRWDKTLNISIPKDLLVDKPVVWLVLTETWCGDAAPSLPVMQKFALAIPNVTLKIVFRDQNKGLIDYFLTNKARSIPKLIQLQLPTNKVLQTWGPRSKTPTAMVAKQKKEFGALSAEFKASLQQFYNKNKGQEIAQELLQLLALV